MMNCLMREEVWISKVGSIDQINHERQKIRKKSDVDEMATLLQMAKVKQYIRNLQWTPEP